MQDNRYTGRFSAKDNTINSIYIKDERYRKIIEQSTKGRPTSYKKRRKRKPQGITDLAKKAIIFVVIGAGLTAGSGALKNAYNTLENQDQVMYDITFDVTSNTNFYAYNHEQGALNWNYDLDDIANNVLKKDALNAKYDVDTRIYGCYLGLNEYKKEEFMDKIFKKMCNMVESKPELFSEDEINACLHSTFQEYLDSKNLTLEEYKHLMDKVIKAYAKESVEKSEVNELLGNLNGGSR